MTTSDVFSVPLGTHTVAWRQRGGWFVNNAGWIAGPDVTVLVDTCATEARSAALISAALRATPGADTELVAALTHAHGDHANGAGLVTRHGGTVLARAETAHEVAAGPHTYPEVFTYSNWGNITPPRRIQEVAVPTRLDTGSAVVDLLPVPYTAHTTGDLVAWVPHDGVLFTGDLLFHGITPLALSGSILGWLAALEWLDTIDAVRLVPGHGPVATSDDDVVAATAEYLRWLLDVVAEVDEPDFDALERRARHRWPTWPEEERHAINLRVAHAEAHDYPLDFCEALQAMTEATGRDTIQLAL